MSQGQDILKVNKRFLEWIRPCELNWPDSMSDILNLFDSFPENESIKRKS